MPCESCSVQFTVFKRKRVCCECDRYYCNNCIGRGVGLCEPCRILSTRPLGRSALDRLRVRDLQCFLHRQNISTRGCVEKEDLVDLVLAHVNSGNFKKRSPTNPHNDFASTFASIKGFTNNLNHFINSAFDIGSSNDERANRRQQQSNGFQNSSQSNGGSNSDARPTVQRENRRQSRSESSHSASSSSIPTPQSNRSPYVRSPVVEDLRIPENATAEEAREEEIVNEEHVQAENLHRNSTTDCIEVEDIDEEWEFLGQVGDPLPQDSVELLTEVHTPPPLRRVSGLTTSEADLSTRTPTIDTHGESSSYKETGFHFRKLTGRVQLNELKDLSQVENLSVKQLKELLVLNRVDFKGCCERKELLERAKRLWTENTKSREDIEKAPLEDLCKICMDSPMECVMLECGHIATCTACGKRLSECPICRQYVVRVVRFFKS